jgi:hypothetical protein
VIQTSRVYLNTSGHEESARRARRAQQEQVEFIETRPRQVKHERKTVPKAIKSLVMQNNEEGKKKRGRPFGSTSCKKDPLIKMKEKKEKS